MRVLLLSTLLSATCFGQGPEGTSGTWKMNAARSTFAGGAPFRSLTVRIERHPKGEVFTLDRIETDGRATSRRPTRISGCGSRSLERVAEEILRRWQYNLD